MTDSALISINNGNSFQAVCDISDENVTTAIESGLLDQSVSDLAQGVDSRKWLESYCELHRAKFGENLVIG